MISNKTKRLLKRARTLESLRRQSLGDVPKPDPKFHATPTTTTTNTATLVVKDHSAPTLTTCLEKEETLPGHSNNLVTSHDNNIVTSSGQISDKEVQNKSSEKLSESESNVVDLGRYSTHDLKGRVINCSQNLRSSSEVFEYQTDVSKLNDGLRLQINIKLGEWKGGASTKINLQLPFLQQPTTTQVTGDASSSSSSGARNPKISTESESGDRHRRLSSSAYSRFQLLRRTRSCFFYPVSDSRKARKKCLNRYLSTDSYSEYASESVSPCGKSGVEHSSKTNESNSKICDETCLENIGEFSRVECDIEKVTIANTQGESIEESVENMSSTFQNSLALTAEVDPENRLEAEGNSFDFEHRLSSGGGSNQESCDAAGKIMKGRLKKPNQSCKHTGTDNPKTKNPKKTSSQLPTIKLDDAKTDKGRDKKRTYLFSKKHNKQNSSKNFDNLSLMRTENNISPYLSDNTLKPDDVLPKTLKERTSLHSPKTQNRNLSPSSSEQAHARAGKSATAARRDRSSTPHRSGSRMPRESSPVPARQKVYDQVVSHVLCRTSVLSRPILPPIINKQIDNFKEGF